MGPLRVLIATLAFVETDVPARSERSPTKRIDTKLVTFELEANLALVFIVVKQLVLPGLVVLQDWTH